MPATTTERYVVASCHVEQPLDDRVWDALARFQARRQGGVVVATLMRPPDLVAGERDEERWIARAHAAAAHGPLGHHTHWTSPTHARPAGDVDTAARVRAEGAWLRERGVSPTLFCGGGWYSDAAVASACATLGYADCTPRARRPSYLADEEAWVELAAPSVIALPDGVRLGVLPTTHSVGDALRAGLRGTLPGRVHVYFHDTDLVDRRRRVVVEAALRLLGARCECRTLTDELALLAQASTVSWADVARGEPDGSR